VSANQPDKVVAVIGFGVLPEFRPSPGARALCVQSLTEESLNLLSAP
jgi:hypothetical protein